MGLLKGDFLIDDYITGRGQEYFEGELIHFGSNQYPDRLSVRERFT
jgi:5'-nucleotidase